LLGGRRPTSLDDFRQSVALTTYADYRTGFDERREDHLPAKPRWWLRTSGKTGGPGNHKWTPYTPAMVKHLGESFFSIMILAAANSRNEFPFRENDHLLFTLAPHPYLSGAGARALLEEFPFNFLPALERAEKMDFEARMAEGLLEGMKVGIDHFFGLAVILVRIAEQFSQQASGAKISKYLASPQILIRVARAILRARAHGRKHLLPKDIWKVKGLAVGGVDTSLFADRIREAWGREPIAGYGFTEAGGLLSLQPLHAPGMVFQPNLSLLEFIPQSESDKNAADPNYRPQTALLDEVEKDGIYEVVITNFHGGAFTRYRVGDFIRIVTLSDPARGVSTPEMVFHARTNDRIDISALVRLTEFMIWKAVEAGGVSYVDWTACKEYSNGQAYLAIYIELLNDRVDTVQLHDRIRQALREIDPEYVDAESILKTDFLRVALLPHGAFDRFIEARRKTGADAAHIKPPRMQISEAELNLLYGGERGRS
jgi:hypothetical protein